jgi:hypothetical protein
MIPHHTAPRRLVCCERLIVSVCTHRERSAPSPASVYQLAAHPSCQQQVLRGWAGARATGLPSHGDTNVDVPSRAVEFARRGLT